MCLTWYFIVNSVCCNIFVVCLVEGSTQGIEQTDKSAKKHKHRKQVVGEITEEQICRDEG